MRFLLVQCLAVLLICEVNSTRPYRHKRKVDFCGSSARHSGLIVHGSNFTRGDYPWIVALMYTKNGEKGFFCSGTLVSSRHVVTGKNPCFLWISVFNEMEL